MLAKQRRPQAHSGKPYIGRGTISFVASLANRRHSQDLIPIGLWPTRRGGARLIKLPMLTDSQFGEVRKAENRGGGGNYTMEGKKASEMVSEE